MKAGETFELGQEPELAPGVGGYTLDVDGDLWLPLIYAEDEGSGQVGEYLDTLPFDRRVVVPNILSGRLAGMLRRRGFVSETVESSEGSVDALVRRSGATKPGVYEHLKGGIYRVVCEGRHSEDLSPMVVYTSLAGGEVWVRPAAEWTEEVEWPDGVKRARFVPR